MPATHIVTDSGSELSCLEHVEPSLVASEDGGFRNELVHTVENEVTRGKILRTEKPSTSRQQLEYNVVNIMLSKPHCNETHKHRKIDCSKKRKKKTNPCLSESKASSTYTTIAQGSKKNNYQTKIKQQKRCPMRLAELAVPTKRQCIDTWRNKSYILPELMVERLKQYVTDQRPVVQISDAINCFQRRKSTSSKKPSKKKHCKCEIPKEPLRRMEARTLCAIFGQKIAETLTPPLNLSLGSNYDKISNVVSADIANIMYGRKNANKSINRSIHAEMSNKVTMWILNILEDASYKLLLEDIKDLEEEEGPVLDFIDDLVANVVTICEPCPIQYESSSESSCKGEYNVAEESCETPQTKSDIQEFDDIELTDAEYFNNEITNIINNLEKDTEDDKENENMDEINENVGSDTYESEAIQEQNDVELEGNPTDDSNNDGAIEEQKDVEPGIKISDENTDADQINDEIDLENPEENDLDIVQTEDGNENEDSNVSEVFEIFSEELLHDDKNKKVKFSLIDMVNQDESMQFGHAGTRHKLSEENLSHEQEEVTWKPYSYYKSDIDFSKPNQHLLSDADESWPNDLSSLSLKASESVSKSINSLGNIIESDENNVTPSENEDKIKDAQEIGDQIIHTFEYLVSSHKDIIGETDDKNVLIKKSDDSKTPKEAEIKSIADLQTMMNTQQFEKKIDEKSQTINDKNNKGSEDFIDKYYFEANNSNSFKNEDKYVEIIENMPMLATQKMNKVEITAVASEPVEDTSWSKNRQIAVIEIGHEIDDSNIDRKIKKVYLESVVPSWVIHNRGEPNEDPISITLTTIQDSDIRNWCKHLENGFKNLELWTKWIDKIDQDINSFKLKKEFCARCSCVKRQSKQITKWTKLIKHVKRDTVLWRNVFRRSQEKFKRFRRIYHCKRIEVAPTACCMCRCTCKNW